MDKSPFTLYVDRLRDGHSETISFRAPPAFLSVDEPQLSFPEEVTGKGEAYLAQDHLIIELEVRTTALLPCKMCNEMAPFPLKPAPFRLAIPLEEIRGAIYSYEEELRSALLLELPLASECRGGRCPLRTSLKISGAAKEEPVHFPFLEL